MKSSLTSFLFFLICSHLYSQQRNAKPFQFTIDAGAGIYSTFYSPKQGVNGKGSAGISYLLSANYFNKKNVLKIRYLNHDEFFSGTFGPTPLEKFIDVGLLYGRTIYSGNKSNLNILGGEGFVKGSMRGKYIPYIPSPDYSPNFSDWLGPFYFGEEYEEVKIFTPAFIQEAEFVYYPSKYFGLGISLTGNINSKNSHWAGFFKLCIGKYR
jgi:hypothetical protein